MDKFHDLLSVQVLSVGMENIQDLLLPLLVRILREDGQSIRGVFLRNDVALREKEGTGQEARDRAQPVSYTHLANVNDIPRGYAMTGKLNLRADPREYRRWNLFSAILGLGLIAAGWVWHSFCLLSTSRCV